MHYPGPPPTTRPPVDWRPPVVARPPAARQLPPQDHAALDAAELAARQVTWAIAGIAGGIALLVGCGLLAPLLP